MAGSAQTVSLNGGWSTLTALVAADGSGGHAVVRALERPQASARDLADAVHALCMLHGRQPGVLDHADARHAYPAAQPWLAVAAQGFAEERAYLAQLVAAAGPLPSTPGQRETDATIAAQNHALDMLAQSDRTGCAAGAAVALVLDWRGIRVLLDRAADRFGVTPPAMQLPDEAETGAVIAALGEPAAVERAMGFGAQQLLAQHRGLWELIGARAHARNAA